MKAPETKICIVCEDPFPRPAGKSAKVWEAQQCCGKDCSAISRRKENPVSGTDRRLELTPGARRYGGIPRRSKEEVKRDRRRFAVGL